MQILTRLSPPKPTPVYDTFWKFAAERQAVFFRRFHREPAPWTRDPIIVNFKFTNAYRAADRVSQYLIRNVLYQGPASPEETFFRCLLFKFFNRQSTWELLRGALGEITLATCPFDACGDVLDQAMRQGQRIFSAAYIMPSHAAGFNNPSKHRNYLALLRKMTTEGLAGRLTDCISMSEAFALVRQYPLIGDFLAYQFVTDLNYSTLTNFSEMEFVRPGPGAKEGIHKCFTSRGDMDECDVIRFVVDKQAEEFRRLGLTFRSLWGRPLQLIDCQNLFCEVAKYARVAHPKVAGTTGRNRIKQKFTENPQVIDYFFPPKWGLNHLVDAQRNQAARNLDPQDHPTAGTRDNES